MTIKSQCTLTVFSVFVVFGAAGQTAQADLSITSITGTVNLGRYFHSTTGNPPDMYADGNPDSITDSFGSGDTFTEISASTNTLSTTAVDGTTWGDSTSGGTTVTFTGLNSAGDNWTGLGVNTSGAATFINSDSISIDFSALYVDSGVGPAGTFTLVPEPSSGFMLLLVLSGLACLRHR